MKTVLGYHGEWNMGSPGGWEYQRIAQMLGRMAWDQVLKNVEVGVDVDFEHPQINAVPGFARMMLRAHAKRHGKNPVHAVILAETDTLDVVLENKRFVNYLNSLDGVSASLAGPGHLSMRNGKVRCRGVEATVIFMDFNLNKLSSIADHEGIEPIKQAIRQGLLVNPRGMEPLGAKGLFESITGRYRGELTDETVGHTPWTRLFYPRSTSGPNGEPIADLVCWTQQHWKDLVLKPTTGYSGHGIFVGFKMQNPHACIEHALGAGDYIVQKLVPLDLWSECSVWPDPAERRPSLEIWQTDFRCFITDEGLQGFLARFGGVPTNVGSGGGVQPLAVLAGRMRPRLVVERINEALFKLGYQALSQIQREVEEKASEMGFTYLLGPIRIALRPRLLTSGHLVELRRYARSLWTDAVKLENLWRHGRLDDVIRIGGEERDLAMSQLWGGRPALMASDGLFNFTADLMQQV